jgi:HAMP domain-containing protein
MTNLVSFALGAACGMMATLWVCRAAIDRARAKGQVIWKGEK